MPFIKSGGFDEIRRCIDLEPHAHDSFEFTYISEGEVTWELEDGSSLNLHGGSAAIIGPHVNHHGKDCVIQPSRLFWLVLNPLAKDSTRNTLFDGVQLRLMDEIFRKAGNKTWRADSELAHSFEELFTLMERKAAGTENEGLLLALGRTIVCRFLLAAACSLSRAEPNLAKEKAFLSGARVFLLENLHDKPGVSELAAHFGLSPARFSVCFKRETGMTPADYLRRIRCEEAIRLMRDTSLSITEIAFRLGFASGQHFSGVFKKYFGASPKGFRAQPKP
ncbi:MAG: hypothetical protein A2X49_17365 [Lentisphaerae bacterium GWF2_52_8]|nr:MAG: hypothetical protein A2X49_17365 [Lentisphaerae bacterium GWF2_52_8]